MRFQIHQNRAISTPFCPSKIVDTDHAWGILGIHTLPDEAARASWSDWRATASVRQDAHQLGRQRLLPRCTEVASPFESDEGLDQQGQRDLLETSCEDKLGWDNESAAPGSAKLPPGPNREGSACGE